MLGVRRKKSDDDCVPLTKSTKQNEISVAGATELRRRVAPATRIPNVDRISFC